MIPLKNECKKNGNTYFKVSAFCIEVDEWFRIRFMNVNTYVDDLTVIVNYLQYNFNRLDDLSRNVNNKIELEKTI